MSFRPVKYENAKVEKAIDEGLHLVTIDIVGKHAKRLGGTYQGFLFTEAEVEKAWAFFEWLSQGKERVTT